MRAYDPGGRRRKRSASTATAPDLVLCKNADEALEGADALVIVTEWKEFRSPDFDAPEDSCSKSPVIFDGRNLYDPAMVERFGFTYYAIGRGKSLHSR